MDLTMMDLWDHMGLFARGIVITLVGMSVLSFSVACSKWFRFRRMAAATRAFAPPFSEALEANNVTEALALTEQFPKSHVATVLGQSLRDVAPLLDDPNVAGAAISSAERSIEREQILLANDLKSGMGLMATVAASAPFVGLLGTTWGVITAFQGMATMGGGIEAISAGIAEALITTAIGLIVAITAVWLYNYFTGRVETLFTELAYAGREMIDWMVSRQTAKRSRTAAVAGD